MSQSSLLFARMREENETVPTGDARWEESKHPRRGGKFAKKGTGTTGKSGGKTFAERFREWEKSANNVHKAMGEYYNIASAKSDKKKKSGRKDARHTSHTAAIVSKIKGIRNRADYKHVEEMIHKAKKDGKIDNAQFKELMEKAQRRARGRGVRFYYA